jgi:hypothetical protein
VVLCGRLKGRGGPREDWTSSSAETYRTVHGIDRYALVLLDKVDGFNVRHRVIADKGGRQYVTLNSALISFPSVSLLTSPIHPLNQVSSAFVSLGSSDILSPTESKKPTHFGSTQKQKTNRKTKT